ncbi:hypothetical protein DV735_g5288, partial [Chaetothyriales sp. CBS 134920]
MPSLDGSTLEGGGQLVRVALALSAITATPLHLYNIRANRAPPMRSGLKESHLAALHWLADQTGASVEGAELGSQDVKFRPRRRAGARTGVQKQQTGEHDAVNHRHRHHHTIELKKPGSVWLVLQAILPYAVFGMAKGEKRVDFTLTGGTNVDKSMSGEYVQQVMLPTLHKIGLPATVQVEIVKRGWACGVAPEIGEVKVGGGLEGFQVVNRGEIEKISISIVAHPESLRRQVIDKVTQQVGQRFKVPIVEAVVDEDSGHESRFYLLLVAHSSHGWRIGRDFLGTGAKIRSAGQVERLVEESVSRAVAALDTELRHGGCVDEHLQDQLVIFQALARGSSVVDAGIGRGDGTLHTQTVRWVCKEMLGEEECAGS